MSMKKPEIIKRDRIIKTFIDSDELIIELLSL